MEMRRDPENIQTSPINQTSSEIPSFRTSNMNRSKNACNVSSIIFLKSGGNLSSVARELLNFQFFCKAFYSICSLERCRRRGDAPPPARELYCKPVLVFPNICHLNLPFMYLYQITYYTSIQVEVSV